MNINKVHCLFEQSGTFKNEFIKLGIPAEDYDILNDFGQTDHIIDLFAEIRGGYNAEPSIFDTFSKDDLIMAFFPCTRFEDQIMLHFRGQSYQQANWTDEKKLKHSIVLHRELSEMYETITELCLLCIERQLRLIIENPWSYQHYLKQYWCLEPAIIDKDRRQRGDYYKKPTQYFFINCEPQNNFIFEALNMNAIQGKRVQKCMNATNWEKATGEKATRKVARSMIHPDYANRFIREYIMDERK